ncbi:hypothetical protein ACJX0J_016197, partial [Zea mays]
MMASARPGERATSFVVACSLLSRFVRQNDVAPSQLGLGIKGEVEQQRTPATINLLPGADGEETERRKETMELFPQSAGFGVKDPTAAPSKQDAMAAAKLREQLNALLSSMITSRPHMQCPRLPPPASCPRLAFVTFSAPTPLLCLRLASPRSVLLLKPAPPAPKFFDLDGGGVWVRLTNVGAVVTSSPPPNEDPLLNYGQQHTAINMRCNVPKAKSTQQSMPNGGHGYIVKWTEYVIRGNVRAIDKANETALTRFLSSLMDYNPTDKGSDEVVFKAMGRAINKTVMVVELIKRRIVGLHQNTTTGSTDITDMWEPLEEGLLPLETTRHVSMITITLSKKELDTSYIGVDCPSPPRLRIPRRETSRHPHALTLRESPAAPQAPRSPPTAILFAFFPPPNPPLPWHRSFSRLLRRIPRPHHSRGLAQASPLPSTASQSREPEAPAGTPSIWELELLSDGANVYKLIGPVLVKHDLAETKANVKKHIEYISAELKRMDRALKDLEEKQNKKKESMFTLFRIIVGSTISVIISFMWKLNVAADIQTMLEETQLKFEEERQNLLKVLSNTSKEQCEGSLNEEYNKFQETYDMFCKEKDAHMQTFRGGSVDCPRLPAYKSPAAKPAVTRTPSRSANPPPRLKLRVAHPPQSCHPEQGNPHFVRDVRMLVKPYKEKGKVPGRFRKLQHAHHGGAEFAGCASPTGLLDSRDPYALLLLSGAQVVEDGLREASFEIGLDDQKVHKEMDEIYTVFINISTPINVYNKLFVLQSTLQATIISRIPWSP